MSNARFARECGIEERTFANYCQGYREPSLETLVTICRKMGVTPNDVLLEDRQALDQREKLIERLAAALTDMSVVDIATVTTAMETIVALRRESEA